MVLFLQIILIIFVLPLIPLTIVAIVKSRKPIHKALSIISCVIVSSVFLSVGLIVSESENSIIHDASTKQDDISSYEGLAFLDDFTKYGYTVDQINDMKTVLVNVGITEITKLEIENVVSGMQVFKGLVYKDTSFLADANDEVQVQVNIENGKIYLISIYCPSYYTANKPTYLSGLTDRRADLYYDIKGGYLKKIDWETKSVVDY